MVNKTHGLAACEMKQIFLFIILYSFAIHQIFAQKFPGINFGYGMPNIFHNYDSRSGGNHYLTKESSYLFVEIPVGFELSKTLEISLRPGFGSSKFHESESGGGNGGGSSKTLFHKASSIYGKLILNMKFESDNNFNLYFGTVFGKYLKSISVGKESFWAMQEYGTWRSSNEINKSGEDFFGSGYFGLVMGFKPSLKKLPLLEPAFEIISFPQYVVLYDSFKRVERDNPKKRSNFILSLIVGINPLKRKQQ